jgi:hypothetical protein
MKRRNCLCAVSFVDVVGGVVAVVDSLMIAVVSEILILAVVDSGN